MTRIILRTILFSLVLFVFVKISYSADESFRQYYGTVIEEIERNEASFKGTFQKLQIKLKDGSVVVVENNPDFNTRNIEYKKGNKVVLQKVGDSTAGEEIYIITDFQRTPYLYLLFVLFIIIALIIGRKYGLYSLVGMAISFLVIFKFILPRIIAGANPVVVTTFASTFIIPVTFYLSHGFNKKTHIAIVSTVITLVFTVILTSIFVNLAKLTGYSSEEAMFLQVARENINMKGILLAGIIIGFLGVLDDVTVSQSSVVMQLRKSNENLGTLELYQQAMKVGRDHITSMINTLVLVYTGASMPLLLLFINNPRSFSEIINMELVADEIVRTLIGSVGLILAVPLSTILASLVAETD